jgi:biotin-dependent carboxylase-like uncharacterized protein
MSLRVHKPGLLTTVQDEGRTGVYHLGMPPAGAMDKFSYRIANMLVGNQPGAAALEITYLGPELEVLADTVVAVTGADMPITRNGEPLEPWTSHAVKAGDVIAFAFLKSGARAYLAVAGGIDVPLVMGSRSTYTLVGMGGFEGRGLAKDDEVTLLPDGQGTPGRSVPEDLRPVYGRETELRLVVGLASYRLTPDALTGFFDTTWTVTPDANRTGYRYRGGELHFVERTPPHGAGSDPANVTDIGYPVGSIQVPGGTEPIALLCDAVTGGGYATIATIISADLDRAGQSKTNDTTRFVEVDRDAALQARHESRAHLERVREAIGAD